MSFLTCFWLLPQNEHFSRSPPSPMRATRRSFQLVCPERGALRVVVRRSAGTARSRWPRRAGFVPANTGRSAARTAFPVRAPCPVPVPRRYRRPPAHTLIERRCRRGVTGVPPRADNTPRATARTVARAAWRQAASAPVLRDAAAVARASGVERALAAEPGPRRSGRTPWPSAADRILSRSMSLLDLLDGAAGVLGQRLLEPGAHAQHLVGLDLDVARPGRSRRRRGPAGGSGSARSAGRTACPAHRHRAGRRRPRPPGR